MSEVALQNLQVRVTTRANADLVAGWQSESREVLAIRVSAAPEGGKANTAIIKALAQSLQIPKTSIKISRGHNARLKTLCFMMAADAFEAWRNSLPILPLP